MPEAVADTIRAAGACLAGWPERHDLGLALPPRITVAKAIYLGYARDGTLHYIGKVDRTNGTTGQRVREHLRRSRSKRVAWRTLWVVPLHPATSSVGIVSLERELILRWRPPANIQHAA
jgi:hypothetical protein